ncbi:MAG: pyruvate dehydrogenase (acetyl-transferring), homodimeric type, partial [Actinomycetota bacterium]|nr:pyruvate dehydrogenase (acetyl-transferring), homodimeric type [Actinomycetota bacterium]
ARGFLLGATAGRTTLNGEGLQHEDGQSMLIAATNPACVAYDPSFAFEIAVIVEDALRRMYGDEPEDVIYYLTLYNEPVLQPPMPQWLDPSLIIKGLYRYRPAPERTNHAQLLASGTAMRLALEAQELLASDWDVAVDVWSAPGWNELARDGIACDTWNRMHPNGERRIPWVSRSLADLPGPFVAVSDYMKEVPGQIADWIPGRYAVLGTDGFGLSDTRQVLRRHFRIDPPSIVVAVLSELAAQGDVKVETVKKAITSYDIDPEAHTPVESVAWVHRPS